MNNSDNPKNIENEISLFDFYQIILRKKIKIFTFIFITTLLAITYSLVATPYFKSYISIYPETNSSNTSGLSQFKGIASTLGFNFGNQTNTPFYLPDLVRSRMLQKEVVLNEWNTNKSESPINLISYWEFDKNSRFNIKKIIKSIFNSNNSGNAILKQTELAIEELNDLISVNEEESGLISISVFTEEPQLSADIVNFIGEIIKKYISKDVFIKASENRIFLENRLETSKLDLANSEEMLTKFRKNHPIALDTPELQQQRGRLIRDLTVNQEVYITLRQQYEIAKLEELKAIPIINILDAGEPASEKSKPKRTLIVLLTIITSFFSSVYYYYIKQLIKSKN